MTALPAASAFTAEPMTAQALSDALVAVRDYLAGVAGTDGTQAGALAALGALAGLYEARSGTGSVAAGDRGKWLGCTGSWTLSLLAAATAGAGFAVIVANAGSGTITVDPADAETIDGAATATLEAGRAAILISTGSGWASAALPGAGGGPLLAPAAGTAAAPALAFPGDADTGIYRSAANTLGLSAGGTARALLSSAAFQIDVAVTGTAAQATASDATPGRLLKNGAHGIGGAVVTLFGTADLKDRALPGGNYSFVGNVVPGGPEASAYFYSLLVLHGSDGRRQFLCWRNQTSGVIIVWFGQQASDGTGAITWTRAITHANLLGTVTMAGGVPTGAVIERGSNANGHYLRLACGTQICRHSLALGSIKAAGTGTRADPFRTAATTWTFPAAFIAAPAVTGDAWNATTVATRIACSLNAQVAPTTTAVPLIAFRNTDDATDDSMTAMAVAVGLWI